MYKYLNELNVKSNLPNHQISDYLRKNFRTSSEIRKYDCSFEEAFLAESNTKADSNPLAARRKISRTDSSTSTDSTNTIRRRSSAIRNEEIMKSLAALKEDFGEESNNNSTQISTQNTINNSKDHILTSKPDSRNNGAVLRMKAEIAAELYLGVDDAGKFLRFLDFYVKLFESNSSSSSFEAPDNQIVKAFNLFDGDVLKSKEFLIISQELEELGFEEDKVLSALMLNSNDREAALDFLMKN